MISFTNLIHQRNKICLVVLSALYAGLYLPVLNASADNEEPKAYNPYITVMNMHMPALASKTTAEEKELKKLEADNAEVMKNIFKISNMKIPPVQETEKLRLGYNLFASNYKPNNQATIINPQTLNDLELFCGYTGNLDHYVFKHIDHTTTTAGKIQLQRMLLEPISSIHQIKYRQEIIQALVANTPLLVSITKELKKIALAEQEFLWFWKSMNAEITRLLDSMYAPNFLGLSALNKYPAFLHYQKLSNTLFMPGFLLLGTLIAAGYAIHNRSPIAGIWALYAGFSSSLFISLAMLQQNMVNTVHNKMNHVAQLNSACMQLASIIQDSSLSTLFQTQDILKNVINPATDDSKYLVDLLQKTTFTSEPNMLSYQGRALVAFKMMNTIKESFFRSYTTIAQLDAYVSIALLYKKYQKHPTATFCFAKYITADKPYLNIENFWLPSLNPDKVVTNSIELGKKDAASNMIITGPNAGGKSTSLRAITLAVLLAQSFGIAPATAMALTPYSKIQTYTNIADTAGSASLFQAEMRRVSSLLKMIKELTPSEFAFIIMDEIFTGTNAKEGQAGAYGVAKKLASFNSTNCILATHFKALTELEQVTNGNIANHKVCVVKNPNGSFTFPYKLERGITDQAIALDLLQQEGFDADILDAAHEIANRPQVAAAAA